MLLYLLEGLSYLFLLFVLGFIIVKHHSKKQSPVLIIQDFNAQKSMIVYILSWTIIVFSLLLTFGFLLHSTDIVNLLAFVGLVLVPIIFVLIALGILYYGLTLLITGKGYFYPGSRYLLPIKGDESFVGKLLTRLWGFVFLFAGLMLSLLISSFFCNLVINSKLGLCSAPDFSLKWMNVYFTTWIGKGIGILSLSSFVYWAANKFKRNL